MSEIVHRCPGCGQPTGHVVLVCPTCAASQQRIAELERDFEAARVVAAERGAEVDTLAAWSCATCGARFADSVPPGSLDGVTRCSSCVKLEHAEAEIARLRAEVLALSNERDELQERLERGDGALGDQPCPDV